MNAREGLVVAALARPFASVEVLWMRVHGIVSIINGYLPASERVCAVDGLHDDDPEWCSIGVVRERDRAEVEIPQQYVVQSRIALAASWFSGVVVSSLVHSFGKLSDDEGQRRWFRMTKDTIQDPARLSVLRTWSWQIRYRKSWVFDLLRLIALMIDDHPRSRAWAARGWREHLEARSRIEVLTPQIDVVEQGGSICFMVDGVDLIGVIEEELAEATQHSRLTSASFAAAHWVLTLAKERVNL